MSSNDGFSVVAPTRVTVPSSITGRKESCCARLKRWISSTKRSVPFPVWRRARAVSNTFFRSATPEKTAEICSKWRSVSRASRRATVVLPVPGGPQKMSDPSDAGIEHARDHAVGAEQVILADDLGKRLRTQAVGERPRRCLLQPGGLEEICHRRSYIRNWELSIRPFRSMVICQMRKRSEQHFGQTLGRVDGDPVDLDNDVAAHQPRLIRRRPRGNEADDHALRIARIGELLGDGRRKVEHLGAGQRRSPANFQFVARHCFRRGFERERRRIVLARRGQRRAWPKRRCPWSPGDS